MLLWTAISWAINQPGRFWSDKAITMDPTEELARFAVENAKHFVYETVAACLLGSGSSLGKTIAEVLEKGYPFDEWRMASF